MGFVIKLYLIPKIRKSNYSQRIREETIKLLKEESRKRKVSTADFFVGSKIQSAIGPMYTTVPPRQAAHIKQEPPAERKKGTIVVRLSAEQARKYMVSGDGSNGELRLKLPLKFTLSNGPQQALKAHIVIANQPAINKVFSYEPVHLTPEGKEPSVKLQEDLQDPLQDEEPIEQGDLFEENPTVEDWKGPWKTVSEFFFHIREEINSNSVYAALLDPALIEEILSERDSLHLNFQQTQQVLALVLQYMALSKNYAQQAKSQVPELPTPLEERSFALKLGGDWRRLKEDIFNSNKNILKVLDYIHAKCEDEGSRYTHCYFNLNFDLTAEELAKVVQAVKYQCRYNLKAFCFLTNYLFTACRQLEKLSAPIREIEDKLVNVLTKLIREHPPSHSPQGDDSLLFRHASFSLSKSEYPAHNVHLHSVPRQKRIQLLQSVIEARAKDAQRHSAAFSRLIKDICARKGAHLTAGVKIKSMKKRRAIERVKQKVLDSISRNHRAEFVLEVNPNLPIDAYTQAEFEQYRRRLNQVFLSMQESIEFGVDDLLRGRCVFSSLDVLNNCCEQLKKEIPLRGYKLLALSNRLREKSCDILLFIRMGETIAELQLVLTYKLVQNDFSAKLHHLRQALFYNHITHLRLYNQKLTYLFLQEAYAYLRGNSRPCKIEYNEKTSYQDTRNNLERFVRNLPFKFDHAEIAEHEIQLSMLAAEATEFQAIASQPCLNKAVSPQRNRHVGDFLYELGRYDQSLKHEEDYCRGVQKQHRELIDNLESRELTQSEREVLKKYAGALNTIGKAYMRKKTYNLAVEYLNKSERLTKHLGNRDEYLVETLQEKGEIQHRRSNLPKAIQIYKDLLNLHESSGKGSPEQHAATLEALGLVHQHQGNYYEALKNFQALLSLLEREKGKEHIQLAKVYNHIGATYHLEGCLANSLASYKRSLGIVEKEKGRNSIDCAAVLANIALIYESDSNYYEAIHHYQKAFLICSKHNLKEAIYANAAFGMGKCYSSLKNYNRSIEAYEKALQIFEKNKGQMYFATVTDIAVAYESMGEDDKASKYYRILQAQ